MGTRFAVLDVDGNILRQGSCPEGDVALQAGPQETVMVLTGEAFDDVWKKIVDGRPVEKYTAQEKADIAQVDQDSRQEQADRIADIKIKISQLTDANLRDILTYLLGFVFIVLLVGCTSVPKTEEQVRQAEVRQGCIELCRDEGQMFSRSMCREIYWPSPSGEIHPVTRCSCICQASLHRRR